MAKDTGFRSEAQLQAASGLTHHVPGIAPRHHRLELTTAQAKGEKYDFGAKEKDYDARPDQAPRRERMEAAIAASYAVIDAPGFKPPPSLIGARAPGRALRKLCQSYRVNGVVPPVSRRSRNPGSGIEDQGLKTIPDPRPLPSAAARPPCRSCTGCVVSCAPARARAAYRDTTQSVARGVHRRFTAQYTFP